VVNTNPLYTEKGLNTSCDSGAAALVVLEFCLDRRTSCLTSVRRIIVTAVGDLLPFPKIALR
jgi:hypothetical protein